MFGKREKQPESSAGQLEPATPSAAEVGGATTKTQAAPAPKPVSKPVEPAPEPQPAEIDPADLHRFNEAKTSIFSTLVESIDLTELGKLDAETMRKSVV